MNCSQLIGVAMGVEHHLLMCRFKKAYSLENSASYIGNRGAGALVYERM